MNKSMLISLVLIVLLGVTVSRVKYEVIFLRKKSQSLQSELEKCLDDIVVYSAEWSYLNDPNRLKKLCLKHLKDMKPMSSAQIINHENLMNEQYEEIYDTDNGTHKKDAFHSYVDKILEE